MNLTVAAVLAIGLLVAWDIFWCGIVGNIAHRRRRNR